MTPGGMGTKRCHRTSLVCLLHIPWHSFALGQRYTGLIFHTYAPHNAPTFMLISSAIMVAIVGQGTMRCFVAPNAHKKIAATTGRVECKLLWLKGKGTRGWKSRRSWRKQMIWRRKANCKAKLRAHLA